MRPAAWVDFCSRYGPLGHELLVGGFDVALDFAERLVAADRHDLGRSASGLGETPARGLAQSMQWAAAHSGLASPKLETVCEAVRGEGLAILGDKEGEIVGRRSVEDRLQLRVDWNVERRSSFLLPHVELAVTKVLLTHADQIGAPLAGVERQR